METQQPLTINNHEIVRAEYFAHTNEPTIIFNPAQDFVYVNAVCLKRLPDMVYAQFLIFPSGKNLSLRFCPAGVQGAVRLRSAGKYANRARHIRCQEFMRKIIALMQWHRDYRYKLLGHIIKCNEETIISFDLDSYETFKPVDGVNNKISAVVSYPPGWDDRFGAKFEDHIHNPLVKIFTQDTEIHLDDEGGGQT